MAWTDNIFPIPVFKDPHCLHLLDPLPGESVHVEAACAPQCLAEYRRYCCHVSGYLLLQHRVSVMVHHITNIKSERIATWYTAFLGQILVRFNLALC